MVNLHNDPNIKKAHSLLLKEWAMATQDVTSVTPLSFKRPVALHSILLNRMPFSIISFSALERLSKVQFSISRVQVSHSTFLLYKIGIICQQMCDRKR